jgi:TrpR-related protein YerC/YecD
MEMNENEGYCLLIKALINIQNEKDAADLLEDLMTRKEIMDIAQRMLVAKMLSEQIVYNKIVEETGASTATISRVNRSYLYGAGGYKKALGQIAEEKNEND